MVDVQMNQADNRSPATRSLIESSQRTDVLRSSSGCRSWYGHAMLWLVLEVEVHDNQERYKESPGRPHVVCLVKMLQIDNTIACVLGLRACVREFTICNSSYGVIVDVYVVMATTLMRNTIGVTVVCRPRPCELFVTIVCAMSSKKTSSSRSVSEYIILFSHLQYYRTWKQYSKHKLGDTEEQKHTITLFMDEEPVSPSSISDKSLMNLERVTTTDQLANKN